MAATSEVRLDGRDGTGTDSVDGRRTAGAGRIGQSLSLKNVCTFVKLLLGPLKMKPAEQHQITSSFGWN